MTAQPPDWPPGLPPPDVPDWEQSATRWLYDQVPADYRSYEVLRRYPVLLSRLAAEHVHACLDAARAGWRTARHDLVDTIPADAVQAVLQAYEREGRRLGILDRQVRAVDRALRGRRWVPRL